MAVEIKSRLTERLRKMPLENSSNDEPTTWGQLLQFDVERIKRGYLSGVAALNTWIDANGNTAIQAEHPLMPIVFGLRPNGTPESKKLQVGNNSWVVLERGDNGTIGATIYDVQYNLIGLTTTDGKLTRQISVSHNQVGGFACRNKIQS
jgi:hypothetical protein